MPKLDTTLQTAVENAPEAEGFQPLPAGKYTGNLTKVESGSSDKAIWWNLEFEEIHDLDGNKKPGRQFHRLFMPTAKPAPGQDKKKWEQSSEIRQRELKQFFTAGGFTSDSDTDEMIGTTYGLQLKIETIQGGARQGEPTNRVVRLFEADEQREVATDEDGF